MAKKVVDISQRKDGDEIIFELSVNREIVSSARILPYGFLGTIRTKGTERRKGYGKTLLLHIEKNAKKHNISVMTTTNIDPHDKQAISFFTNLNYEVKRIKNDENGFLMGEKTL